MKFETPVEIDLNTPRFGKPFFSTEVLSKWQEMANWLSRNDILYFQKDVIHSGVYALPMTIEMEESDAIVFRLRFGV